MAQQKAAEIISAASESAPKNQAEELIALMKAVYETFTPDEPSKHWPLKLRPYVTNTKLPPFLRLEDGVIETIIETGLCDNAARFLYFVLKQKGYESVQWNMVTGSRAHSVLLVHLDGGRTVLLDPLFGFAGSDRKTGTLLSPFEMQERMRGGAALEDVLLAFNENPDAEFYGDFADVRMAALGDPLEIAVDLPLAKEGAIFLGQVDGNDQDVYDAAAANGMSPFWHYAGHKYDRSWVRTLKVHQDVTLEFVLVSDVESSVITSDMKPEVEGKIMRWNLKKGDVLKFHDGRAQRSWARMNSYINIDQIAVRPL